MLSHDRPTYDGGPPGGWQLLRCTPEPHREALWLHTEGEIDLSTVSLLQEHLDESMTAGFDRVVLDLHRTTFLDSTGLRAILRAEASARDHDVAFVVLAGPPGVRRIFELTGTTYLLAPDALGGKAAGWG